MTPGSASVDTTILIMILFMKYKYIVHDRRHFVVGVDIPLKQDLDMLPNGNFDCRLASVTASSSESYQIRGFCRAYS